VGDTTAVSVQTTDQSLQAGGMEKRELEGQIREAANLAAREAPCQFSHCQSGTDLFIFPDRPVLCHDDAPGRASDRNTEDDCPSDTPLLSVGAGVSIPGVEDAGRAPWWG
jgi:hypothetical protein